MTVLPSASASALQGIRVSLERLDRAARVIAASGLDDPAPDAATADPAGPAAGVDSLDLTGAVLDMMLAQRAFSANLRVFETADAMTREVISLAGH